MSRGVLSAWAAPRPSALLGRAARSLPFPLDEPRCRLYAWGRSALWQGLGAVGLEPGDEVLMPAYHYGAEVQTLVDRELVPRFYEARDDLEPDPDELQGLLGPRTRALYLIHTLGFSLDGPRWRRWCDERGLLLIEDGAQAWLAERDGGPVGDWGDLAFFSPWKTYGLPDGGAVICRGVEPPPLVSPRRGLPLRTLGRGYLRRVAQRSRLLAAAKGRHRPPPSWDAAVEFSVPRPHDGPSALSVYMLRRSVSGDTAAVRRALYESLVARLGPHVPPPFAEPQEGSCPFGVPVTTQRKEELMRHLLERGISPVDFWSVPHPLLPVEQFPAAARRRASTLLLPLHQDLDEADVDRIADAVLGFLAGAGAAGRDETAPDFELLDQDGAAVSLADFAGRSVILYFYPEADTPGCTKQACGLRDHQAEIAARGAVTLGVSPDDPGKLSAFAERYSLPFKLLSDPGGRVARRYGAWKRARRPPFRGENQRTTFLIGPDATIQRVFADVDPASHDQLVLEALDGA